MKKIHLITIALIFTSSYTAFGMLLAARTSSLHRSTGVTRKFYSSKPTLQSKKNKSYENCTTEQLCAKLTIVLKEQDAIVVQLLQRRHRIKLINYPGYSYPLEREIISRMKESTELFAELKRKIELD